MTPEEHQQQLEERLRREQEMIAAARKVNDEFHEWMVNEGLIKCKPAKT